MSEQVVRKCGRLGVLGVREPGHQCLDVLLRARYQDLPEPDQFAHHHQQLIAQAHADAGGNLIIPAASGVHAPACVLADHLDQSRLDRGMDILFYGKRGDASVLYPIECREYERRDFQRYDAFFCQHHDMRTVYGKIRIKYPSVSSERGCERQNILRL